jgi:hypothetical protein
MHRTGTEVRITQTLQQLPDVAEFISHSGEPEAGQYLVVHVGVEKGLHLRVVH